MFAVLRFVCLLLVAVAAQAKDDKDKDMPVMPPVPISVYYESLCPDSIKFFTKQLFPAYEKFGNFMDITLIPYGKTKHLKTENNTWSFDCHHGPPECYGNKVQACALTHLESVSDRMNFVNCVMDKVKPKSSDPYPGEKCASKLGLSYDPIMTCVNGTEGDDKLAMLGDKTNALQPKLNSVPTIVFKSSYNRKDQELAVQDFQMALCSYIGGNKSHKECKSGAMANQAAIFVTLVAAIFIKIVS